MSCPCGTSDSFEICCKPFLDGATHAPTAEKLMRSRYAAFTCGNVDYIKKTLAPESQKDFDMKSTRDWVKEATWKGLKILSTKGGSPTDKKGTVEFIVTYSQKGDTLEHHEVSQFRKTESGTWLFVDGESHTHKEGEDHHHHHKPQTVVREAPKIGRNEPCPCLSGKKYKKCCGAQ